MTKAPLRDAAGGYTIHITADGSGNYTNELQAFTGGKTSGPLLLFFRIYESGTWIMGGLSDAGTSS